MILLEGDDIVLDYTDGIAEVRRPDKRIRRGMFRSVPPLIDAIMNCIQTHNENPKP